MRVALSVMSTWSCPAAVGRGSLTSSLCAPWWTRLYSFLVWQLRVFKQWVSHWRQHLIPIFVDFPGSGVPKAAH